MKKDGITRLDMLKQAGMFGTVGVVGIGSSVSIAAARAISKEIRLPVALSSDSSKNEEIAATLILPPEPTCKPSIQLLVHDITDGRYYYDFPYDHVR